MTGQERNPVRVVESRLDILCNDYPIIPFIFLVFSFVLLVSLKILSNLVQIGYDRKFPVVTTERLYENNNDYTLGQVVVEVGVKKKRSVFDVFSWDRLKSVFMTSLNFLL